MAGNEDSRLSKEKEDEIREIVRKEMIENGFDANGTESRKKNIQRFHFVDRMIASYSNLTVNIGRAVAWVLVAALMGAVWLGIKMKVLQ